MKHITKVLQKVIVHHGVVIVTQPLNSCGKSNELQMWPLSEPRFMVMFQIESLI